jgi:hypothetical protein
MHFTYVRRQFIYENVCVSHLSGALNRIKMHSHRSAINQPPVVNALLSALTLNVSVCVCVDGKYVMKNRGPLTVQNNENDTQKKGPFTATSACYLRRFVHERPLSFAGWNKTCCTKRTTFKMKKYLNIKR